ncbi:strawberry notch family protein [Novosphingobium sp. 9U]|uniref:strawberry notch family protein n=1 Tax=Novosphingobium sp. 9U TaxID=2653158 RepID=UPI0012F0AF63|nr:strawberry notch family protein [Novosphingobium sp. 9U]VWX51038.1 Methylase [Novosphingobium sp. 9U]
MTDLFSNMAAIDTGEDTIAEAIAAGTIDRKLLNAVMTKVCGTTDAAGAWTQRDSFELLERGLVRHLQTLAAPASLGEVASRHQLLQMLPTQTVRSEDQIAWQQFSTPVDLAALAVVLAQATPEDVVLEPSAGNGLLVAQLPRVHALQLNELDEGRRRHLGPSFPSAAISGYDGAALASTMAHMQRPTLILMNPPFSRSYGRGADQNAAARHLQAAIRRLAPGGRVVAVMPDWFASSPRMKEVYEAALRDTTAQTSVRIERCFEKHGTGIAVRLYVIDKKPGHIMPVTIQRATLLEAAAAVTIVPRTKPSNPPVATIAPKRSTSLFKAVRSTGQAAQTVVRTAVVNEVLPVSYVALDAARPLGDQVGVYLPYRPSRIDFAAAGEHPTPLVESVAMGSIAAPKPTHIPRLHQRIVTERMLSEPQLETVVYAGSAWEQWLPGKFVPEKKGVGLELSEHGRAYRKGYFLGDGTGAGKGRQIASCILDNWLQGRRRAIWVSKNAELIEDARRDWTALGGLSGDVQPLSDWKIDEPLKLSEGILFVTYPTLRSQRQDTTRLKQILDWAGPDFEGVIGFDEAHEMGGVAGEEGALGAKAGSQQGICGVLLQNHLPDARVLYASATGASDVNNLAYAVRLGLWGPGTSFADREQFISDIRSGGVAAMELVARDLKATGLYAARALSFAGVEYDILKHDLTADQIEIYDSYADAWMVIHQNLEHALELTGVVDELEGKTLNTGAMAAARSRFESCKQRFFGQLLLGMKIPTLIRAMEEHLAADKSIVIQLVTTAESILDRRLGQLSAEERADLDIDLSPREYVIDYLDRAFPTQQMEPYTDETGAVRSAPMYDAAGHPVHNPEAEAAKAELLEHLCGLPPIRPALDAVIEHFGTDAVAEVTGRTKRLVNVPGGGQKVESRSSRTGQADAAAFMAGTKRILVFSDAGGTGRSYHASLDARNQQQRVHFLLEPGWRADRAIQGLGRTHRTHQASAPLFTPLTTNSRGELRFTSTIARRLDSLGALTRGQRQTGGQNLFDPADNLESEYAKAALVTWFHLLVAGKLTSTNLHDFERRTGLKLTCEDGAIVEELPPIQRFLNRLLALPIALQNAIFDEFLDLIETRIAAARQAGTLDIGVETILVEKARVVDDTVLRTDPHTGATSHLITLEVQKRLKPVDLDRALAIAEFEEGAAFLRNTKSGKVALRLRTRSMMLETGEVLKRFSLMRPTRTETKLARDLTESAWELTDEATFRRQWEEEAQDAGSRIETSTIRVATGLLLPIWSALSKHSLAVNRIVDGEGASWLGRLVYEDQVPELLKKFGIDATTKLSPEEMVASVLQGGEIEITTPWPVTIRSSRVNLQNGTEIIGAPAAQLPWFKSLGCFTEIIQYKTRLFIPVDQAGTIIPQLMAGV